MFRVSRRYDRRPVAGTTVLGNYGQALTHAVSLRNVKLYCKKRV